MQGFTGGNVQPAAPAVPASRGWLSADRAAVLFIGEVGRHPGAGGMAAALRKPLRPDLIRHHSSETGPTGW